MTKLNHKIFLKSDFILFYFFPIPHPFGNKWSLLTDMLKWVVHVHSYVITYHIIVLLFTYVSKWGWWFGGNIFIQKNAKMIYCRNILFPELTSAAMCMCTFCFCRSIASHQSTTSHNHPARVRVQLVMHLKHGSR